MMSTNNPTDDYLKLIGQRVLAEQMAAQQQQQPTVDARLSQSNRNHQIMSQLAQQKQQQQIEMARQKASQFETERELRLAKEAQERAERAEIQLKAEIFAEWDAAGLPRASLDAATMTRLVKEKQLEHLQSYQEKMRARSPARGAI